MAYTQTQYEVQLTAADHDTDTAGNAGTLWSPGFNPHIVRAFSVTLASGNGVAGTILLRKIALASGATAVTLATIMLSASLDVQGDVIYKELATEVEVAPGETLFVNVPTAITGGPNIKASVLVEPRWERPGNNLLMRATA